jgi:uncharacterized protein YcfJ
MITVSKLSELLPMVAMVAIVVLSACAIVPDGPSVMVLPGAHKTFEQFREDEAICRQYAQDAVGQTTPEQAAANSAVGSAVAGTALGAAAGALIGAASGQAGQGAAIGAGSGLLVGSMAGSGAVELSAGAVQRRYDIAYMQCMYTKNNQIPMPAGYGGLSSRYPPPPPPPSPPPYGRSLPPGEPYSSPPPSPPPYGGSPPPGEPYSSPPALGTPNAP